MYSTDIMRKTESKPTLTYNVRLVAPKEVTDYWLRLLGEAAKAYDACAKFVKENGVTLNAFAIHHACYDWMREQFAMLSSQMVIRICRDVCGALRSVRSNGKEWKAKTSEKQNLSMRLAVFLSMKASGSKSFTSAASFTLYSVISKEVMGAKPVFSSFTALQYSSTPIPVGVTAPIPVTTTLLLLI